MNPTTIIYRAAGQPPMDTPMHGTCRVCGESCDGVSFGAWVRDTFTDHDKLLPGTILCPACQFCFSEATPGLAERLGKDKPQKMRNYSHFVVAGVWYPLSKGDKSQMRDLLFRRPDVAIIAVSGQKHIIFRSKVGWWQFEEQAMKPIPSQLLAVLSVVNTLLGAGFSKTEIETGRYIQKRIIDAGFALWSEAESQLRDWRGGLPLHIALFLAQKGDDEPGTDRE